MSIISLDVGTSGMKAVVYGLDGLKRTETCYEYHTYFPQPGYVEQDPHSWKNAAIYCLKGISDYLSTNHITPKAITITSQRSSLIPVDQEGTPLRSAIMWQDKRTLKQCEALVVEHTLEKLYLRTGLRINPYFVLPKIMWLKENQREIYDNTYKDRKSVV